MRTILAAVLALILLSPVALAADKTCSIATEPEFRANIAPLKAKILRGNEKALSAILVKFNDSRKSRGLFMLEADKLLIGVFNKGPQTMIGVVMFKDGCVVPGSVQTVPVEVWVNFLLEIGIKFEDFRIEASA